MRQVINNINVYYEFYPHQSAHTTIVLLHGFLSSTFTFRHLIPLLNQDYQVLSVDLPPFGKSEKSSRFVYSYKNIANTVTGLIEFLGQERVTLIGHSMGGQIVLNILHYMPGFAEKAILISSSSYLKRFAPSLIAASYMPFFHLFLKRWLAKTGVKGNLENVLYNRELINDDMITGYSEPFLDNEIFIALSKMIRHREGDLPANLLNEIKTPCLLIWGEHDKSVPLHIGERLKKDLMYSHLIVLTETGHAVPEERPYETYQYIKRFLGEEKLELL